MSDNYLKYINFYDLLIEPVVNGTRKKGMRLYPPRKDMLVLDVGCGTGTQLAMYQKAGCRVYGVDTSPSMLTTARNKLGESAELFQEDATSMHFPDGMFDLVMMELSLHENRPETRKAVLDECIRVLKPDGRIMIIEFNIEKFSGVIGWFRKLGVSLVEFSAGKEHYAGFRNFAANNGVEAVIREHDLRIEKQGSSTSGIFAVYLLKH